MMKQCLLSLVITIHLFGIVYGQNQEASPGEERPPCHHPELEKTSFLKGKWNVLSRMRENFENDNWLEANAQSEWTAILDGCVLQENWTGTLDGQPLEWVQLLAYDHREEKWEQLQIDTGHGNMVTAEGFFENGKLIFNVPHLRHGKLLIDKVTIETIDENQFEWAMKTSLDGGESWINFWTMTYTRK